MYIEASSISWSSLRDSLSVCFRLLLGVWIASWLGTVCTVGGEQCYHHTAESIMTQVFSTVSGLITKQFFDSNLNTFSFGINTHTRRYIRVSMA